MSMESTTRRQFIKTAGGAALGLIAISGLSGGILSCAKPEKATSPSPSPSATALAFPWPYTKIDSVAAAERAYTAYYNGGCMYGAFEGIIGELREQIGSPYSSFPAAMMKYGGAGVSGWGTLCGALNAAAAAIFLVCDPKVGNPLINEVYGWYGATALPNYAPAQPKFPSIATSISESQLCHVSVTRWADATGFKTTSPERAERCAWLTASVVKYTVELLNKQSDGTFQATFAVPASVTGCLSCHGKGGIKENVHITNQSQCINCHSDLGAQHPALPK